MLRTGSENFSSRRDIARRCEELYGCTLGVTVSRFADAQALIGTVDFPADKYLPKGSRVMQDSLSLLGEVLLHPALEDRSAFRAELVESQRQQLIHDLRALEDDKPGYAALLASQRTYKGTAGAIQEHGTIAEVEKISSEDLARRHQIVTTGSPVMAFVTGPIGTNKALKALQAALVLPKGRRKKLPPAVVPATRTTPGRSSLKADTEQVHLIHDWSGGPTMGSKLGPAMLFANGIFGGYSFSRLFKIVREQHGLAYSVYSTFHRARGVMSAQAAVDPARATKAASLIRSEFKRLQRDGFSEEEFETCRQTLLEGRRGAFDNPAARVSDCMFQTVLGFRKTPEQQMRELKRVTPSKVQAVLKTLKPHSEFRYG
jgi:predicted Zn-dependent peptidase